MASPYLTVLDAAGFFSVTPETVRKWIAAGKLYAVRLPGGREYRIYAEDLKLVLEPTAGGAA